MFVRTKKVNNAYYAYLVENTWKKNAAHQKVKAYLGKVIELKQIKNAPLEWSKKKKELLKNIIKTELLCLDFTKRTKNIFHKDDIIVNLSNKTVTKKNKNIVLKINDGYLHSFSIKEILKIKHHESEKKPGMNIANILTKAGVKISQENFIKLYTFLQEETLNN